VNLIAQFAPDFLRKIQLYPEMLIVVASNEGLDALRLYGNKVVYIDGTHSLLENRMQLAGIAVRDKCGSIIFPSFSYSLFPFGSLYFNKEK
jgi:hypothetical protein